MLFSFIDTYNMTHIPSQILPEMDSLTVQRLIDCHYNNPVKRFYPQRTFSHNLEEAVDIVLPIIHQTLGKDNWELYGGNFFETSIAYRVHADTGFDGPEKVWQTIVFPLELDATSEAELDKNRLLIFNQQWDGASSIFIKGGDPHPETMKQSSYDKVMDYKNIVGLRLTGRDEYAAGLCPHLNKEDFDGLSMEASFLWKPGTPLTFPRNKLHCSTAFTHFGIKKKLGLSLFFSKKSKS